MIAIRLVLARLRALFGRDATADEIHEGLRFPVERTDESARRGLHARLVAPRRFGNAAVARDRGDDVRGRGVLESIVHDVASANEVRTLRFRSWLTLALGIGVSTALVIGVRVAFGARPAQVVRVMTREAFWPVALGLIAGLACTYYATRVIRSFLFQTAPRDPVTLVAVVVLLGVAACLAAWLPARRAASVDPLSALRAEQPAARSKPGAQNLEPARAQSPEPVYVCDRFPQPLLPTRVRRRHSHVSHVPPCLDR